MEALAGGFVNNLDDFYFLARSILVKSESYYDHYDVAFQEYFQGIEAPEEINEQILEWLNDPINRMALTEGQKSLFDDMNFDELMKELEKRIKEQTEAHNGGNYWIGRGGTSPFGHSGTHPNGIRIGGQSRNRSAIQIAHERKFLNYRNDLTLDVRQIKLALKGLRQLNREGPEDELDLEETIDATARNVGDIELIWRRPRKNAVKVLLLMDVGGSMDPYAILCSQLFSAAHSSHHFKDFKYYYFHNCIYDDVFKDMQQNEPTSIDYLLQTLEPDYKVIFVGDARMGHWELLEKYGSINYYERNEIPGIVRLQSIARHFTHMVWLNPDSARFWFHPTVQMIGKLFPMFPLTVEGLGQAVKKLVVKR